MNTATEPAPVETSEEELTPLSMRFALVCDQVLAELKESRETASTADDANLMLVANRFFQAVATTLGVPFGTVVHWPAEPHNLEALRIPEAQVQEFLQKPLEGDQARFIEAFTTNVGSRPDAYPLLRAFADVFAGKAEQLDKPA